MPEVVKVQDNFPFIDWGTEPDPKRLSAAVAKLGEGDPQAMADLSELADRGSIASMLYIGREYCVRGSKIKDLGKAKAWYARAAATGSLHAMCSLGRLYYGEGSYPRALELFRRASESGFGPAMFRMGLMYQYGHGVDRDLDAARRYFEAGASTGHVWSSRNLAQLTMMGRFGIARIPAGVWLWLTQLLRIPKIILSEEEGNDLE